MMKNEVFGVENQQINTFNMDKPFHKCRLCFKLGDFCSIFEQDDSIKLSEMVMSFANIQIFEGDGFSDRVCTSCIENLSTAYLFKLQCERVNALLPKLPEEQLNKPAIFEYNDLLTKEFHMHAKSVEGENVQNVIKEEAHVGTSLEVSDETDSDVDSIVCVYCNQSHSSLGAHSCRVICSIENNNLKRSSSSETLVANDVTLSDTAKLITMTPEKPLPLLISCVLCDDKFDKYESYVSHFNKCTLNVKLQHLVCPVCHEIHTEKLAYLEHLRVVHFKFDLIMTESDVDCVDRVPMYEKTRKPKAVRRQIGWSIEDIYQEIDCKKIEDNQTPNSSPIKIMNVTYSNQSTPKKVSFRKFFETSKAKTSNYLPFRKYIQSYRLKKKVNSYSPIKNKLQATSRLKCWHDELSDTDYNSPSGTSEDSWKLKQNLICTCNKSVFMLSEFIHDRDRIVAMINELGGVVAENTKMEMLATHFVAVLPDDTFTGMMVCALSTGKWLLHINYIYDSFRSKRFLNIFEGDGFSDRVCTSCIENLSTAYLFKLQCERVNALLPKLPEEQLNKPAIFEYNDLLTKEFHMHAKSVEGENVQNVIKEEAHVGTSLEVSDETDSDVDSIVCVYCNQSHSSLGAHSCRVICSIENNNLKRSSSSETLVANDVTLSDTAKLITMTPEKPLPLLISCVLCDDKFDKYESYVSHFNKCTLNVKLQHLVCPVCHEIHTEKLAYLEHLRVVHFKFDLIMTESDVDCVDRVPMYEKTRKPKAVRRQIGWSIEDIYQEIDCKKIEDNQTPNSSPIKIMNVTYSNQSTPKKVSFRKFFETSKAKTSNYLPFRKYIQSYRLKKKVNSYSPIKNKLQATSRLKCWHDELSDTDYNSPSGTSEDSWKLKQNLICTCNKSVFMLSEFIHDRDRIVAMINELGGVVAENTKMEMLATHFVAVLPDDTFTGMMVCALSTGKWLLHINYIYDSFRSKRFLNENLYEWIKHPKILEIDNTSVEVAKASVFWHLELQALSAKFPFEGKQIVLIMKKKYRQYYQMIFKTLKAKPITYDPRTPGSCCTADYCFVDMKVIQRVKLRFFARHHVPVFPYQYILVYLLSRGRVADEHKYLLQEYQSIQSEDTVDLFNNTC